MKYKVLRRLRWRGKNFERGEILIPKNEDEASRCQILSETGTLAPIVSDALLKNLQAVGSVFSQRVRPISTVSNNVKQEAKEDGE